MIVFPNCKINLGLNIIRKRDDGFHDLETVFYPVPLCDVLEVIKFEDEKSYNQLQFSITGLTVNGSAEENICAKAFELVRKEHFSIPSIHLHLHKAIPAGAGLGGGSTDASFTLKVLNDYFELGLSADLLATLALSLGSDCPFFLLNKPALAVGRGELLEPIELELEDYQVLIVNPGIHISTSDVFARIKPAQPAQRIHDIIQLPIDTWKDLLTNDFEKIVFGKYPEIGKIKEVLYQNGARYASLSGSGSTVYGLFKKGADIEIEFPSDYYLKLLQL